MGLKRSALSVLWAVFLLSAAGPGRAAPDARQQEQREKAAAVLEQDVKAHPDNAELWLHLGFAYRKLERMDKAQQAFEKAVSLDPKSQESLYMLALIHEKKEEKQKALQTWRQYLAVVTDPEKKDVAEKHIHHLSQ